MWCWLTMLGSQPSSNFCLIVLTVSHFSPRPVFVYKFLTLSSWSLQFVPISQILSQESPLLDLIQNPKPPKLEWKVFLGRT